MILELYKCSCEFNRLDKTDYLTPYNDNDGEYSITGVLREETSIIAPIIDIDFSNWFDHDFGFTDGIVPTFNYVYIPTFNRYYYVDNIVVVTDRIFTLELSVDVLMSYKDAILGCDAYVLRNESFYNPAIIDPKRPIQQGVDVYTEVVENKVMLEPDNMGLSNIGYNYVLNGYKIWAHSEGQG